MSFRFELGDGPDMMLATFSKGFPDKLFTELGIEKMSSQQLYSSLKKLRDLKHPIVSSDEKKLGLQLSLLSALTQTTLKNHWTRVKSEKSSWQKQEDTRQRNQQIELRKTQLEVINTLSERMGAGGITKQTEYALLQNAIPSRVTNPAMVAKVLNASLFEVILSLCLCTGIVHK